MTKSRLDELKYIYDGKSSSDDVVMECLEEIDSCWKLINELHNDVETAEQKYRDIT